MTPEASIPNADDQIGKAMRIVVHGQRAFITLPLEDRDLQSFEAKQLAARAAKGIGGKLDAIAEVDGEGHSVVCADGHFRVRVRPDGTKKSVGELVAANNLAVEARLG